MSPPLCRDCRWFKRPNECDAPANRTGLIKMNRVDPGAHEIMMHRWLTANHQRNMGWIRARLFFACGREGRWWEQRRDD